MLSNLEIIVWKKCRGQPNIGRGRRPSPIWLSEEFFDPIISKLDKYLALLLINYIAREVIQLCKENYSNCLWRKTDWALDLPKLGKASKISGDLRRSPEIVTSLRKFWKCSGALRKSWGNLRKVFGRALEVIKGSLEIFEKVRVIFGNLRKCSGDIWKSLELFRWSSEIFENVRGIFGNLRKVSCGLR